MKVEFESEVSATQLKNLSLDDVKIGDIKTNISIEGCELGYLDLQFSCGYRITVHPRGVTFSRAVCRPDHDHDDTEYLMIHNKKKTLKWVNRSFKAPADDSYEPFFVEFGSVTN